MNIISFGWLVVLVTEFTHVAYANWITGNLCWSMPCLNGGSCFGSAYTYLCVCPVNYSGALCERRLGICQESPCGNRGLCIETGLTSFECRCYFDYMGPLCEEHVPKKNPSIWSSLIPVHTRVLFDILQDAYRAKAHGRSTINSHNDFINFSEFLSTDDRTFIPITTSPTSTGLTSLNPPSDTTENEHTIQATNIQLQNIFPAVSTTSISSMITQTLSTQENISNNEYISSTSYETDTIDSSTILAEELTSITSSSATTMENLTTISFEANETMSSNIAEPQEFANTTEQSVVMQDNSTYLDQSSYNSEKNTTSFTSEVVFNSTEQIIIFTVNENEESIPNTTPQIMGKISFQTSNYSSNDNDTDLFNTTEQTIASTMGTADQSYTTDQSSHSQLLYKLCQQLLSHILPNISSTTAVEAALSLTAELPSTKNNTAETLLTWIQQKFSSTTTTTTTTTTISTTTTATTEIPSSSLSLSALLTNGRKISLQRVDIDDVLYQINDNTDDDDHHHLP
ncbi:unnamed protein product [Adineta ricciae]|uniref:EGF-like domain-containing protein n=1 Tax=Adineta ricciae TaxID=249248 RepID=A0A814HQ69_ADIRI|nr:unnamed protein product [Adineta ricciae]CAF1423843.1 unnamed protein product [Adineta ricciae]